ncbi:uncharacterized protein RAG0_07599 [Rhynchosporium agropyri]|uniref:Small ribosomal subunit protein mS38 n=2 Tax=Rhynchosporium TaxID=38037 RepID=A0A1E1MD98_RHYSE|nr:uncharacterized protein RAG0_07599 [Rhynchosporium agropyri]CZT47073.1 uncharacterized protein RSE6_07599 [Rhynchosporium secalis]
MFTSSMRRVAFTAPQTPIASTLHLSSIAPRTATQIFSCRQRRHSSSKPSSPADGSRGVNEINSAPEKKSKKKVKDTTAANLSAQGRDESMRHLPSVPSTQHIPHLQICASDFFSLYRPMSLTHIFPKAVTDEAFASIFKPRTKTSKTEGVISVLSEIQQDFENMSRQMSGGVKISAVQAAEEGWNDTDDVRADITAESYRRKDTISQTKNLDAVMRGQDVVESSMEFPTHIMRGRYRPFHPPPVPLPQDTSESLLAGAEAAAQESAEEDPEPLLRTYTAMLTIKESTDANGDVTYLAHSSPLIEDAPRAGPTKFLERMQQRRERYRKQRPGQTDMLAISVKRQRKLKMKKHKYKKLMRRTRNLRRRLDRN